MSKTVSTSLLVTMLLSSAAAAAEDMSGLDALLGESVSTTASKSAQSSTEVPALNVNVTAEDLRRYGIRTLAEAYDFLALGIVAEDPLASPEIGARGVLLSNDAGKHILLMIDGHVTNDQRNGASYHGHDAGIPIELIDHIEIMLGPGSVLYGSNAMLGVVNVVTKKANDYAGVHAILEAGTSPSQNRAHQLAFPTSSSQSIGDLGKQLRAGVGLGETLRVLGTPTQITAQIEYNALTGPTLGWTPIATGNFNYGPRAPIGLWGGETRDSYYQQTPSAYVRVQRGALQLTVHALSTHTSAPYSRVQESLRDFDDPQSYGDRRYGAFDLSWSHVVSNVTSVMARVYGDSSRQRSQVRGSTFLGCLGTQINGCTRTAEGHAEWLGTELQTNVRWLADRSMSTTVGVEARVRAIGLEGGLRDLATNAVSTTFGKYQDTQGAAAVYAQQVYSPSSDISLNIGARWDIDQQFGHRISPRAAAAFEVWEGGTAKLIYSEAFRAPSAEEVHLTNPYLVLAAPGLAPETVRSVEALVQQRFGSKRLLFGIFRSWWENMVLRERLSQNELSAGQRAGQLDSSTVTVFQFRNAARVDDYGMNASFEGTAVGGRLSYGANLTSAFARVRTPTGSQLVAVTPSMYGNARASYDLGNGLPVVGLASQLSGKRLADNAQDPGVRRLQYAPPMLDLRLTVSGPFPRLKHLSYRFVADYAFTTSNPYAASAGGSDPNKTELVPFNRATALMGLQYDFQ